MTITVGINGFGRIGRATLAHISESLRNDIKVVKVNATGPIETAAHLMRYDSVHGRFAGDVRVSGNTLDLGRGLYSSIRICEFMPPAPMEVTPARRGSSRPSRPSGRCQGASSRWTRNGEDAKGMSGFSVSACSGTRRATSTIPHSTRGTRSFVMSSTGFGSRAGVSVRREVDPPDRHRR